MSTNLIKKSAVALAVGSVLTAGSVVAAQSFVVSGTPEMAGQTQHSKNKSIAEVEKVRFIVQLEEAPLATYKGGIVGLAATSADTTGDAKLNLDSKSAVQYSSFIKAKQKSVASKLAALGNVKVTQSFDTLFNGLVVEAAEGAEASLRNVPGVKKVFRDQEYEVQMDASHTVIKSAEAWVSLGGQSEAGKGVKVAVIDSGIRPENPMFSGEGFPAAEFTEAQLAHLESNPDYCRQTLASFCNNKVIVAREFYPQPAGLHPDEYNSPLGYDAHGTHVSGTAVGNPVQITYKGADVTLSGVAPAAYLMAYKALWHKEGGRASGTGAALLGALDAAVKDGADVINNSWGGGAGGNPGNSPYATAFEAAEEAGVVVVTAAGNDGPGARTIGCPGCVESGMTVANTQTGRFFAQVLTVNGEEYLANEGSNEILSGSLDLPLISAELKQPDNFEGCNEYTDKELFKGAIALVSRGSCAFTDKAANAAAAGATAIVIHNNTAGGAMGMSMDAATIPAVSVAQEDGKTLVDILTAAEGEVTAMMSDETKRLIVSKYVDALNSGSSRGPNGEPNFLKPDIAAPGTDILSAFSPDEGNGATFASISGTSMASPHVAGAAALMKQEHPEWSAVDIKTALMSTSQMTGINKQDAETPADAFDIGAGRLDIPSALDAKLSFVHGSYSDPSCLGTCAFTNTLKNKMAESGEWTATVVAEDSALDISVEPSTIMLGAMGAEDGSDSKEFALDIDTTYASNKGWNFGHVVWTHTSGKVAHLPFAIYASEADNNVVLSTSVESDSSNSAAPAKASVMLSNTVFSDEITLDVKLDGARLLAGASVKEKLVGGVGSLTVDAENNALQWVGTLDKSEFKISEDGILGASSLVDDFGIDKQPCDGACDEITKTFNWSYSFDGQDYTQLTVSDNGFISVGGFVDTNGSYSPQNMPDAKAPNGIIAPLWADMNLTGTDAGDTGGGAIAVGVLTGGGDRFLVVEWYKAQEYDGDGSEYTFQVIIKENSDQIWFNYVDVPSMPSNYSIGVESTDGTTGLTNNSINTAAGTGHLIEKMIGGTISLDYQVEAMNHSDLTSADSITTDEETAVTVNVLANDAGESRFTIDSNVTSVAGNDAFRSLKGVRVKGALEASTVEVMTQPANGTASVMEDGTISYTPATAFSGTDSFTYTVRQASGTKSEETTVNVVVNDTNTLPEVTVTEEVSVNEGATVTLEASATDAEQDADSLTYAWTQKSGTEVELTDADKAMATFTAGSLDSGTDVLEFEVTVNDGSQSSVTKMITVTVSDVPVVTPPVVVEPKKKSSSGSLAWLMLLATPFAFLRRRKSQK